MRHNKNIEVVPASGDTPEMYEYDVDIYTPQEYAQARIAAAELAQADVDDAIIDTQYRLILLELGV